MNHYAIEYWWESSISPLLDIHMSAIIEARSAQDARERFASVNGRDIEITGTKELVLIKKAAA